MTHAPDALLAPTGSGRLAGCRDGIAPPVASCSLVGIVWEIGGRFTGTPAYVLPAPSRIWQAFWADSGSLLYHSGITAFEAIAGFALGSLLGMLLGTIF